MRQQSKSFYRIALSVCTIALIGCSSSVEKADIPSTANPQAEITKFENMMADAMAKNVDVLAPKEFKKSHSMLLEAKSDLAYNQKQEEILDDVRIGRGHLTKAYKVAEPRQGLAPGVFEARQYALRAGASQKASLKSEFQDVDSDLAHKADSLAKLKADDLSEFPKKYVDLERRAVVSTQLGDAQAILKGAKKDDADSKAPNVYKRTEVALKDAESLINTNVRSPSAYEKTVAQANRQASLLDNVMLTIEQNKNLSEAAALKMVSQNTQIRNLNRERNTAQASVEMQKALEEARSQFSDDEAEAYQQGHNLLIRMKKMNFSSGQADLPASSLASLAKVSEVAKTLNAKTIKVEGHTDSTGPEAVNMEISEARADAVASYLKSNGFNNIEVESTGYGFQKPIATNKSKEGRTLNRRVDIVITPAESNQTDIQ